MNLLNTLVSKFPTQIIICKWQYSNSSLRNISSQWGIMPFTLCITFVCLLWSFLTQFVLFCSAVQGSLIYGVFSYIFGIDRILKFFLLKVIWQYTSGFCWTFARYYPCIIHKKFAVVIRQYGALVKLSLQTWTITLLAAVMSRLWRLSPDAMDSTVQITNSAKQSCQNCSAYWQVQHSVWEPCTGFPLNKESIFKMATTV